MPETSMALAMRCIAHLKSIQLTHRLRIFC
jgi:hypothetical protein